jgi:signal transduction histidine kinase
MHHHPARAMFDQFEDTLGSITRQLRSAIEADARLPPRNGSAVPATGPLQRSRGWTRRDSAEVGSVLLDSLGLAATVEWHVRQFQKCTGIPCELAVTATAGVDLPANLADTIFYIYSEALSNLARHAKASRAAISLNITRREVTLVVRDNGIGLGEGVSSSNQGGLAGMRARARTHKGFCEISGARNVGTTVTVSLPVERT